MSSSLPSPMTRQSPRELIIQVAERLWGDRGIDAVSLRQISAAAGFATPVSVQYHFGDRDGLIHAIFEYRLLNMEDRREKLLHAAQKYGKNLDIKTLLHILLEPFLHQKDDRGIHSFAAFMRQAQYLPRAYDIRSNIELPVTKQILEIVFNSSPDVPPNLMRYRMHFLQISLFEQIVQDPYRESTSGLLSHQHYFNDLVSSVTSALTRPPDADGVELHG